ncbi:MAG: hypothetical protein R2879_15420 [Saprospiraceae bacterium]
MKKNEILQTGLPFGMRLIILSSLLPERKKEITIFLAGDSTTAEYSNNYDVGKDHMKTRYPVTGWGQVFSTLF